MAGSKKTLSFEEALNRLKEISELMEGEELSLEDSMKLFKEGMEISSFCNKKLDDAERKISTLVKGKDGKITEVDFIPGEE